MAPKPPASSRSSSPIHSVASSATKSVKKAVKLIKTAVKKATTVLRPKKKRHTSANTSVDSEGDDVPQPSMVSIDSDNEEEPPDETDEQELKRLQKTWRSAVYGFFKSEVDIGYEDGRKYHQFRCAATKCKGSGKVRRYQDSKDRAATSNLKSHAVKCFGHDAIEAAFNKTDPPSQDGSIFAAFARRGQQPVSVSHRAHTRDETRAHIARWCAESNRPMRIVEDREFHLLMKAGRPGTTLPSPSTVSRDIKRAFEGCRQRIDKILKEHDGQIHIGSDAWTSPNHRACVAWTVHLHHKGHILTFLLDIVEVPESHTGETLAMAFHQMLINHGLENKILSFTGDNATSNDTQAEHLDLLPNSFDLVNRVRCFNHTMQLSAKALLRPFNTDDDDKTPAIPEADTGEFDLDPDDDDDAEDDNVDDDEGIDDEEEEEDPFMALDETAKQALLDNTAGVRLTLTKVRKLSFAIINSTMIALPAWRVACAAHSLRPHLIPRDVKTRWNSTYDMLEMALKYRVALDDVTADKLLKLRKYELDDDDWEVVTDLARVLKIYKDATLFFFQDGVSTIANVIPTMDRIDKLLKDDSTNASLTPAVRHALSFARKILDKYYSKTDISNVYRILMILHPQLKLKYFQQNGWLKDWIDTAVDIIRNEFAKYNTVPETLTKASTLIEDDITDFLDIPIDGIQELDELDEYLSQPLERVRDPIAWWWDHRMVYPRLSRMALDFLSIPATSTAVERVFSKGRHLLHFTRNRLSPASIRAIMCLGDWSRRDLVTVQDFVEAIAGSRKWKRGQRISQESDEN